MVVMKDVYGEVVQQTLSNRRFSYIIYVFMRFPSCISVFQKLSKNSFIHTHTSALKCALN